MSLYEAHLSDWQKKKLGLTQVNTGPGIIKEDHKPILAEIPEPKDERILVEKDE